jgi:hypothetical protein
MGRASLDDLARTLACRVTRRDGLGLLAAAGLVTLGPTADGAARDRKSRKRKRRRTTRRDRCQREGATCASGERCCSGSCDFLVGDGTCAPCRGRSCSSDRPCCGGLDCAGGFCGGCRDRGTACTSDAQCCFSDCHQGACLSAAGGPCARDADCRGCYLGGTCANACVNGSCAV